MYKADLMQYALRLCNIADVLTIENHPQGILIEWTFYKRDVIFHLSKILMTEKQMTDEREIRETQSHFCTLLLHSNYRVN